MDKILQFSKKDIMESVDDYKQNWIVVDNTLYSLCKKNYDHDSKNSINAKLWIIGRTYATGIERMIKSNGNQGDSLSRLAEHLYENRQIVDGIFNKLKSISNGSRLTIDKLEMIISLHGELVGLIKQITIDNQCPRTFVSKYMHFHCPMVPIYDSIASQTLSKFVCWSKKLRIFEKPKTVDEEYFCFALKFWELYKKVSETEKNLKVKYLDNYLLINCEGNPFILPDEGNEITDNDILKNQLRITSKFKSHFPNSSSKLMFIHKNNNYNVKFNHREGRSHVLSLRSTLMESLNINSNNKIRIKKLRSKTYQIERVEL